MGEELHPKSMGSRRKSSSSDYCARWCDPDVCNGFILVGLRVISVHDLVVKLRWERLD